MIEKIKRFCLSIWQDCKNPLTLVILILVCLVVYSPVWVGMILYWVFKWKWALAMAGATAAFWAAPFTPFFPTCIAITLAIKHFFFPESSVKSHPFSKKPSPSKNPQSPHPSAGSGKPK